VLVGPPGKGAPIFDAVTAAGVDAFGTGGGHAEAPSPGLSSSPKAPGPKAPGVAWAPPMSWPYRAGCLFSQVPRALPWAGMSCPYGAPIRCDGWEALGRGGASSASAPALPLRLSPLPNPPPQGGRGPDAAPVRRGSLPRWITPSPALPAREEGVKGCAARGEGLGACVPWRVASALISAPGLRATGRQPGWSPPPLVGEGQGGGGCGAAACLPQAVAGGGIPGGTSPPAQERQVAAAASPLPNPPPRGGRGPESSAKLQASVGVSPRPNPLP
jgi:hypothetical protein